METAPRARQSYFGKFKHNRSVVQTQFIHHPFRYGLTNIVFRSQEGRRIKECQSVESFMCSFDIVTLVLGVQIPRRQTGVHINRCGIPVKTLHTDAKVLMPSVHNETWRLTLLRAIRPI